jgi:hypothetical protein
MSDNTPQTDTAAQRRAASQCTNGGGVSNRIVSSGQVNWWDVHEYVEPMLRRTGSWPMLGTPAWCALDDDDPRKIAALLDAAQHWALRVETCQLAECAAARAVSSAGSWSAISDAIRQRSEFYAEHPWLKRVTA